MSNEKSESRRQLLLAEYGPLREEVNRTIDRMTNNEFGCVAFVFSLIIFELSVPSESPIPDYVVQAFAASLALLVAFLGESRSMVFRRHLDQVDDYLEALEREFGPDVGWTNHYRLWIGPDNARQMGTRAMLWHMLRFVALANAVSVVAVLVT